VAAFGDVKHVGGTVIRGTRRSGVSTDINLAHRADTEMATYLPEAALREIRSGADLAATLAKFLPRV
jgi:hypothetical protein